MAFSDTTLPPLRDSAARRGREIALGLLTEIGAPEFYVEQIQWVGRSRERLEESEEVAECLNQLSGVYENLGHGAGHSVKVAVDAGAVAFIESGVLGFSGPRTDRCVRLAHIAALLHDIRRKEKNHAEAGAIAAEPILRELGMADSDREAVLLAIRNHEAFRPATPAVSPEAQIVSDSLYDADKFRWGPDNFTETLWFMLESAGIPVEAMVKSYPEKIKGIEAISGTFRSATGRRYGPDFIRRGLLIGERLIAALSGL